MPSIAQPPLDMALLDALETPFVIDILTQVRTGKVKPFYNLPVSSAIYKAPRKGAVHVSILGCEGDEQAYMFHGGSEKAVLHYCLLHYDAWKSECPGSAHRFNIGGFGENLVSTSANERNVCIGDTIQIGNDLQLQVSLPRQPCFKLNHRFEVKDIAQRSQDKNRTGWYYRVLREGSIKAGDTIVLISRPNPKWTIADVQHYLHQDTTNVEAMEELVKIPELGLESKNLFENRLRKNFEDQNSRLLGNESLAMNAWLEYRIAAKNKETNRVCSFTLEAIEPTLSNRAIDPGSHIRVKLENRLMRSNSIISGTNNQFEIGVALTQDSRGGSKYLHETTEVGDVVSVSQVTLSFPLSPNADSHILIAGGIGITAFLAAGKQLQESRQRYTLHLAVRSADDVPFRSRLDLLGENVIIYDKSAGQRINVQQITSKATNTTHIYCCGPKSLMDATEGAAKSCGFPTEQLHFEAFGASTTGDPFTAKLAKSGNTIHINECDTLLQVLRSAGIDIPSSCEAGSCGTCRVNVQEGRVDHRGNGLLDSEKSYAMLSCVSRGVGHIGLDI